MLDFGCGAGAREPVLQSWPAELSGFKGPSKVMSEVLRCIKESFRKNLKKYFFREKNFDRNFFRKKKLKKKTCNIKNANGRWAGDLFWKPQDTGGAT